ncbi:MAG: type II toxin-antitoxin system VapC family toxin [Acidimicrobiia bacterium]|nr:type II toxin-antitoxin system VapC family toxin [Acidimicrobiia bacterium]
MIVLDVNVVLAAHRDDHPHHQLVRPWFDELLAGTDRFSVPDAVWASFIRITTNRRIFELPTPMADAFEFIRAVRAQPNHESSTPSRRHLELFEQLCVEYSANGDLAMDAYLAAITLDHGARLATLDGDFARFTPLETVRPATDVR